MALVSEGSTTYSGTVYPLAGRKTSGTYHLKVAVGKLHHVKQASTLRKFFVCQLEGQ